MFSIKWFSSLVENSNSYPSNTSDNLLNCLKIFHVLVKCFKNEFGKIAQLEFVANLASPISKVYAPSALRISVGKRQFSDRLDFGNATTVLTMLTI